MRQRLRIGKARRYGGMFGVAQRVRGALTRGGTDHRVDLLLDDGTMLSFYPFSREPEPHPAKWSNGTPVRWSLRS